jgi:asparagine synthase (glutamine-hydrolysing)|tara:strand:+ start:69 stop:1883 length:1815 start_codon:yes stop_codon:yes gene_type:complete
MCGILALLNNKTTFKKNYITSAIDKLNTEGVEDSNEVYYSDKLYFGLKRQTNNGLGGDSSQPMTINGVTLLCNGKIYNYKSIYNELNSSYDIVTETDSDCEIIIHLYICFGIHQTLRMLDGVFSFILFDNRSVINDPKVFVARDQFGVRPLFVFERDNINDMIVNHSNDTNITRENIVGFASEMKALYPFLSGKKPLVWNNSYTELNNIYKCNYSIMRPYSIKQFPPGTFSEYTIEFKVNAEWKPVLQNKRYICTNIPATMINYNYHNELANIFHKIIFHLEHAVKKRVVGSSEKTIVCLLSGGLDSSIITALVKKHYNGELRTFSIGMKGSEDLKKAKQVAAYLNTTHTEIVMTGDEFFDAIPEVIENIESYDTATVRASVGNYLIGKYISNETDTRVVFNGHGSDELTGGYLYFSKTPSSIEFDRECRNLLDNIHTFDGLRSNMCMSRHGLESSSPFLDSTFVNYYLGLPINLRNPAMSNISNNICEKQLLREAITNVYPDLLPQNIVWRTKGGVIDRVSGNDGSWFEIIQSKFAMMDIIADKKWVHNPPKTKEQMYYRKIYEALYPNTENCIPYFWMPKYVDTDDCSPRTLDIYKHTNTIY